MEQCCQTPILPGYYAKGSTLKFLGSDLGECENMAVKIEEPIEATIILPTSTDAWLGTSVTIGSLSNQASVCPITSWIDNPPDANDSDNAPNSYETTCSYGGTIGVLPDPGNLSIYYRT